MIEQNQHKLHEIARDILDLEIALDESSDPRAQGELLIAIDNLKEHTRLLYEGLVVMRHELTLPRESASDPLLDPTDPTGSDESALYDDPMGPNDYVDQTETLAQLDEHTDPYEVEELTDFSQNNQPPIFEPSTEKIKDIVAQMPPETQQVDDLFESITDGSQEAQEVLSHYQEEIEFEPVLPENEAEETIQTESNQTDDTHFEEEIHSEASTAEHKAETLGDLNSTLPKPKSVNDRWGRLSVGLNDRTAFVQHLFLGDVEGFNRVLSQINTFETLDEVNDFLRDQVKPEYNNWEGKEAVADRLMRLVQQRFNA